MPLNYSKWDMLELSDDSDIEEHPNVDKKSMIRWKQRDIHEKREARKLLIAKLKSELSLNEVLRPRIQAVLKGLNESGLSHFRAVQRRLKEAPSAEKPNTGAANQPTYDMMLSQLLSDVWREAAFLVDGGKWTGREMQVEGKKVDDSTPAPGWSDEASPPESKAGAMQKELAGRLDWHLAELDKRDKDVHAEIEKEEKEMNKKITSDGIHDGFSSSSVNKPKESPLDDKPKVAGKAKEKGKEQVIEVLNPGSASSSKLPEPSPAQEDDDDDIDLTLTPSARAFAQIPLGDWEKSYAFIQRDSSVLTERTHDCLLGEAFDAEKRGDKALAMRCVHQSLLVNYCRQLGRDGVGLFFQKMIQKNPKSITMFNEDFQNTYARVAERTKELAKETEADGEREQIQLVAQDPSMTIGFNLPEGPPPADLRLEGPGTEELDVDEVRRYLQRKWEIFEGFPEKFKVALKTEKLEEVNKVLARMTVAEAEEVVELLQEGGMLSFSESGVRDMTAA